MTPTMAAQIRFIAVATRARLSAADPDWTPMGECDLVSCQLVDDLVAAGIVAHLASGFFKLDWPDPQMSDDVGPGVDVSLPVHRWVELDGFVLDATGDQYDEEVEGGVSPITLLPTAEAWRHRRTEIDPLIEFYTTGPWYCPNHRINT